MSALLKTEPLRKNAHRGRARAAENAHRGFARSRTELHRGVRAWNPHHASGKTPCVRIAASDQVDPIIQFPSDSQSLNPYSYLMNRPFIGTDPSGYEIECANSGKDCSLSGVQKIEVFKGKDGKVTAVASDAKGNMVRVEGISRPTSNGVEATVISQKSLQGAYKGDIASIGTLNKAFGGANSVSGGDYFKEQMNRAAADYAGGFMKTVATSAAMGAACGLSNVAAGACMAYGLGQMEAGDASGAGFALAGVASGLARPAARPSARPETIREPSEGLYQFPDMKAGDIPYVGQASNISRRLSQHEAKGRYAPGSEARTEVLGGKTAREIAEHRRIQQLTGGVPARYSNRVSNRVDPIGPARRYLLEEF